MEYFKKLKIQNNIADHYLLPYEIEWVDLNLIMPEKINQIFSFLDSNYIEDKDCKFRFHYVHEFIALALKAPGWSRFLNIGIKYKRCTKIIGLITAIPKQIIFNKKNFCAPDINFLCLDKRIRNKRFVEIIICEIKRRLNLCGITRAIYTSGVSLPENIFTCNYYHHPINMHKLITFGYLNGFKEKKKKTKKKKSQIKIYLEQIDSKYITIRKKFFLFKIYRYFKQKDFLYWFRLIPGILYSINLNNLKKKEELFTFYSLPSKYIKSKKIIFLYGIYFFYKTSSILNCDFFFVIICIIKKIGFDIINILDSEQNKKELLKADFIKGTGKLNYYIYNYKHEKTNPSDSNIEFF
jgi:glycylpeptide N-tetradecanoyltransferase